MNVSMLCQVYVLTYFNCSYLQPSEACLKFLSFPVGNRVPIFQSWNIISYFRLVSEFIWLLMCFLYVCKCGSQGCLDLGWNPKCTSSSNGTMALSQCTWASFFRILKIKFRCKGVGPAPLCSYFWIFLAKRPCTLNLTQFGKRCGSCNWLACPSFLAFHV